MTDKAGLVADIGGTNARFAVARIRPGGGVELTERRNFRCADYPDINSVTAAYLADRDLQPPRCMSLAVAGPVADNRARLTNLGWTVCGQAMARHFGSREALVTNDLHALGTGLLTLSADGLSPLRPGTANPLGRRIVIGPGTGLGISSLAFRGGAWHVVPCEGGHAGIAVSNLEDWSLVRHRIEEAGRASWEDFLSGPGLLRIHTILSAGSAPTRTPEQIVGEALAGSDALCVAVLDRFCSLLGSFAGDMALCLGATGGVYLAGSILEGLGDYLRSSRFADSFNAKGPMDDYVGRVPVYLVTEPDTVLLGAAEVLRLAMTTTAAATVPAATASPSREHAS